MSRLLPSECKPQPLTGNASAALIRYVLRKGYHIIASILRSVVESTPEGSAIGGCGQQCLKYSTLLDCMERAGRALRALQIERSDRVVTVLPDGPEAALTFLSVASAAICAPLNPKYSQAEFRFYLEDLGAKALIVEAGAESKIIEVAHKMGIRVVHLIRRPDRGTAGFELDSPGLSEPGPDAESEDTALMLHTSGSTSRPKLVPLSHRNLCLSARNIADSLGLSKADRCLNIMPLFHIHGLIGAVLSSLFSGACVICTPGFSPIHFFDWFVEFHPTWYTAVPSMHQMIVARAGARRDAISTSKLRFIRSSSSALAPKLKAGLEDVFQVPVVEAYGMTEASHQMAINPLPPGVRKPGSVGLPSGCEITILDDNGNELPQDSVGAVAIRGPSVMRGYEANPEANAASFTRGWLRTGDEGRIDQDGYLFLTGRIKEIINRGGEKISPREIDEVLLAHPAIAEAMAFSVPHGTLGEDVGAAIVLREGFQAGGMEIREFAAARLADFKVPRKIVFLAELPKGPTGKPQRIGLAERLGLTRSSAAKSTPAFTIEALAASTPEEKLTAEVPPVVVFSSTVAYRAPRTLEEGVLCRLFAEVLGVERVGIDDDFFDMGGHSVTGIQLANRILAELGWELPFRKLLDWPTVSQLASNGRDR
jgi:acyl-CoA synthetase (AMP-forming)/AMP-acid ligase II